MATKVLGRKSTAGPDGTYVPLNRTIAGISLQNDITSAQLLVALGVAPQVNSDWNASSGVAQILNKPNLSLYELLSNKDTVIDPTDAGGTNNTHYATVSAITAYVVSYVAGVVTNAQQWKPAVSAVVDLPVITGSDQNITWLCKVTSTNDVYQRVAGPSSPWTLFSEETDYVDETELATAITNHNQNTGAHSNILALYSLIDGSRAYTGHPGVPSAVGDLSASTDATHYSTRKQVADSVATRLLRAGDTATGAIIGANLDAPLVSQFRNARFIAGTVAAPADLGEGEVAFMYRSGAAMGKIYTKVAGELKTILLEPDNSAPTILDVVMTDVTGVLTVTTSSAPTTKTVKKLIGGTVIAGDWVGTGMTLTFTPTTASDTLENAWVITVA